MNSTATDHPDTTDPLAAILRSLAGVALRLNANAEIASPHRLCKALGVDRDVYDEIVERYTDGTLYMAAPTSREGLVLRALAAAGDVRFKDELAKPPKAGSGLYEFTSLISPDLAAIHRVVGSVFDAYTDGHLVSEDPDEMPYAVACCHMAALALVAVRRSVEHACELDANWTPDRDKEAREAVPSCKLDSVGGGR